MASKYSEAVRQLLEAELKCPYPECLAENTTGPGGLHVTLDEHGLAVCHCCGRDWKPELTR